MSEGVTLEKMKVVVEVDARPYVNEMKKVREAAKEEEREFQKQNGGIQKSMDERLTVTQRLRTALEKANDATHEKLLQALKLPERKDTGQLEAVKAQIKNPLAGQREFEREQFQNPASRAFSAEKELEKNIAAAERQLQKLVARRKELENTGGDTEVTADFQEMRKAAEQAERNLNKLLEKKERLEAIGGAY